MQNNEKDKEAFKFKNKFQNLYLEKNDKHYACKHAESLIDNEDNLLDNDNELFEEPVSPLEER